MTEKRIENKNINKVKWAAGLIKNVGEKLPLERRNYLMSILEENLGPNPSVEEALSLSL